MNTKKIYTVICLLALSAIGIISPSLASMLGISSYAAKKCIDIISTVSDIATIISLCAAVIGAGLVTTAIVAVAKKMIVKYGKTYATAW